MTRWEKFVFAGLLDHRKPKVGIEVGTYRGGSLQVFAEKVENVYSLDISENCQKELQGDFPNVEFRVGPSSVTLPELLCELQEVKADLGFVLIDGDHSRSAVCNDFECFLNYKPQHEMFLVCHGSFNPECRRGMLEARWAEFPYVHQVEIDFVPGVFHDKGSDSPKPGSMWGAGGGLVSFREAEE